MQRSTNRILTTHTGSLPRPDDLVRLLEGHDQREARSEPRFQERVSSAVKEIVQQQVAASVTVVNDGEMSKVGYSTYLTDRVTGFSEQSRPSRHAISDIPADRVWLHLCWGNDEGPHIRDIPLERIIDIVLTANVGAISFEAANPRHAHEWRVFEGLKLPADTILIPGGWIPPPTSWSTLSWWPSASCTTPNWWAEKT